jgi:transcriptional regulator with XRE-family HTH domain
MTPASRHLRSAVARAVAEGRHAMGWSRDELAARASVSSGMVSLIEAGGVNFSCDLAGRLLSTLGVTVDLRYQVPHTETRQRDVAHIACVAYVRRRLEREGWLVLREVEIVHGRSHGWIDVLAYDPVTRVLLVIEVKTEIHDVGRIERTLAWYGREAWAVAKGLGWQPSVVRTWLLIMATEANDARIKANRDAVAQSFPGRAMTMLSPEPPSGLALIDPRSRRRDWLMRARVDGRRSAAPYTDYLDFVRKGGG